MGNVANSHNSRYESKIQADFFSHVKKVYPKLRLLVYSVPNGGKMSGKAGAILASMGTLSGVSDVIVDVANNGFVTLKMEFKTPTGKQSKAQKDWQKAVEQAGHKYVLVRSTEQAINELLDYLDGTNYIE